MHRRQQEMLSSMMARVFGAEPRVAWADLSRLIDLRDVEMTFDGMHLKPDANAIVAAALVEPVIKVASSGGSQ
jgi:hypothetical protein